MAQDRLSDEAISYLLVILNYEFASLRSQRHQKDFFSGLLVARVGSKRSPGFFTFFPLLHICESSRSVVYVFRLRILYPSIS